MKIYKQEIPEAVSAKHITTYLKTAYIRFLKIRGEPGEIALGLALGIMIGMTPFMGLHSVMALFLAAILKWNKIASVIGVFITNPLTAPFIYPVTYMVGKAVVGASHIPHLSKALSLETVVRLVKSSPSILVDLMAGGVIVGLPLSIAAYWIAILMIEKYRRKIKPKLHKRIERRPI